MNFDRLRFVAERAELGEEREAMLAVEIPEQPGSLRQLCELLQKRSLTEFSYRMRASDQAHIFMGVQVKGQQDRADLLASLRSNGYDCLISVMTSSPRCISGTWWEDGFHSRPTLGPAQAGTAVPI